MVTAFQITLLVVILISFIAIGGERNDASLRGNMTVVCSVSIVSFLTTLFIV